MKKVLLTLAMIVFGVALYANEVKINQNFNSFEKLDSIKSILKRDGKFINLNLPKIKDNIYMYDSFIKLKTENCTKYETTIFNFTTDEKMGLNILFYADGTEFIVINNFKGGLVKYKLNS